MIPFDGAFAAQSPQEFIDHVLVERLGAEQVSVGENFRFGHRARGDAALLRAQDAFETRVVELVEVDGEVVSSSHIRGLVAAGDIERANALPRRARSSCAARSRTATSAAARSAIPTANLVPDPALVYPGHGVYACRAAVELDGEWRWWPAATNVGVRPTFVTGRGVLVEAFLLGFEGDLYGRELRLSSSSACAASCASTPSTSWSSRWRRDVEDTRRISRRSSRGCYPARRT